MAQSGNKSLLIIFVKNPEKGKVKTRLAKTIGEENALMIYQQLLEKIKQVTMFLPFSKAIFYSDKIEENDQWENDKYLKFLQEGSDIGERMMNAFQAAFDEGFDKVCLIGGDCYQITSSIIMDTFRKLNDQDVIIGPAEDGGYYLIAMKNMYNALFQNKAWGTDTVFADSIKDFETYSIRYEEVTMLNDIDTEEDLAAVAPELYARIKK